jgi:hypothetical protein
MSANYFTVRSSGNFSMNTEGNNLSWFNAKEKVPSMVVTRDKQSELIIKILTWNSDNGGNMKWTAVTDLNSVMTGYNILRLKARKNYQVFINNKKYKSVKSDSLGKLSFSINAEPHTEDTIEIRPAE